MRIPSFILLFALFTAPAIGQVVTLDSLLTEAADRSNIARWPAAPFRAVQVSSYDRASTNPRDASWYANNDRSHFLRIEESGGRFEHVLLDETGPGAIVRFWATWQGRGGREFSDGTLRFYFNGQVRPSIEGPISKVLGGDLLAGAPWRASVPPGAAAETRGHNLYLPIPYGAGCKITYESDHAIQAGAVDDEALYYQINVRRYDEDALVKTFTMAQLEACRERLDAIGRSLDRGEDAPGLALDTSTFLGVLAPQKTRQISLAEGGAIREIRLKISAADLEQALRSTTLELEFDGESTVAVPIGDFFGTGYRIRPFRSRYLEVEEDGTLISRWVMPYESFADLRLVNRGDQDVTIETAFVRRSDWAWDERSLRFHANWKLRSRHQSGGPRGAHDLNWLSAKGKGVYAGDSLVLFNSAEAWWGEGDEKIYVDGEKHPSHFGTGTEDYYGYAWCRPEPFASPFHAQPDGSGNLKPGYTVNGRWRILDSIPFNKSLQFNMEVWHWRRSRMDLAPTVYWYGRGAAARPDTVDFHTQVRRRVTRDPAELHHFYREPGVLEGESLEAEVESGTREVQELKDLEWNGDRQLWWRDAEVGHRLRTNFDVEVAGWYDLSGAFCAAPDYGVFDFLLDGEIVRRDVDFYCDTLDRRRVLLTRRHLEPGNHVLEAIAKAPNPRALPRRMFGLDYLLLRPAPEGPPVAAGLTPFTRKNWGEVFTARRRDGGESVLIRVDRTPARKRIELGRTLDLPIRVRELKAAKVKEISVDAPTVDEPRTWAPLTSPRGLTIAWPKDIPEFPVFLALDWPGPATLVRNPVIEPRGREFVDPFFVSVTGVPPELDLRYTTDGTFPDERSPLSAGQILIRESCELRVRPFRGRDSCGRMVTARYRRAEAKAAVEGVTVVPGLQYRYYEGEFKKLGDLSKARPLSTGRLAAPTAMPNRQDENFGVYLLGFIEIPEDESWHFRLTSRGGAALNVAGGLVANNDGLHASATSVKGSLRLKKGLHHFFLGYFHGAGKSELKLEWAKGRGPFEEIPDSAWFRSGP